jgi:hypothetical protein
VSQLSNLSLTVEIPQQAPNAQHSTTIHHQNNASSLPHSASSHSLASSLSSVGGGVVAAAATTTTTGTKSRNAHTVHPIPLFNSSTRKVEQIFGNSCPVDVPVKDIISKKDGLSLLLKSKLPLAFFVGHLLTLKRPEHVVSGV